MGANVGHFGLQNPGGESAPGSAGSGVLSALFSNGRSQGTNFEAMFNVVGNSANPFKARYTVPAAGTVNNLAINVVDNTLDGSTVITLYKNGVATALTKTIGAGVTGSTITVGAIAFASGDLISLQMDLTGSTTGGIQANCTLSFKQT